MSRRKWVGPVAFALAAWCAASERAALADEPEAPNEEMPSSVHAHTFDRSDGTNPFRGSILTLEQSITTQTADVGDTPQSYVPLYELWVSLRPRYWFDDHFSVRGRFDYTKELTNDQTTTLYRQDIVGDVWLDGVYSAKLDGLWKGTRADVGLRLLLPTSLASQAAGIYLRTGPRAGAQHEFEINGDSARWLNNAHVSLRTAYLHTLSNSTTPTDYGQFAFTGQQSDEVSGVIDQASGQTLMSDELQIVAEAGVQVTPRLSVAMFGVLFNQWHDRPTAYSVATGTGGYTLPGSTPLSTNDNQFTQNTWLVATVDYDVLDELVLSVGYYNLANAVAPDGNARGALGSDTIWWSPDARFFFSATANLDILLTDVTHPRARPVASQASR